MSTPIVARRTGDGEVTVMVGPVVLFIEDAEAQTLRDQLDVALRMPNPNTPMIEACPVFANFLRDSVIDPPSRL